MDSSKKEKGAFSRRRYGEYQNIFLSDQQYADLQTAYPGKYEEYINRLSVYMTSNGKHYASHYATIRKWLDEDTKAQAGKNYDSEYTYDKGECL